MGTNNNQAGYDRLFTRPWRPCGHYYGFAKLTTAGSTYVFEVIGSTKKNIYPRQGVIFFSNQCEKMKSVWPHVILWWISPTLLWNGHLIAVDSFSTSTAMREMKRSMPKPNPNAIFRDSANNMQIHWTIQLMYTGIRYNGYFSGSISVVLHKAVAEVSKIGNL